LPSPARRTIGRWWRWLQECGPVFRFHLSSRFAEWGRLGEELDYWCHVIGTMGLSRAMAFVNREMLTRARMEPFDSRPNGASRFAA
jgi:hypothetical protein